MLNDAIAISNLSQILKSELNIILNKIHTILNPESQTILYKFVVIPWNISCWDAYLDSEIEPFPQLHRLTALARTGQGEQGEQKQPEVKRQAINADILSDDPVSFIKLGKGVSYDHESPTAFLAWLQHIRRQITLGQSDEKAVGLIWTDTDQRQFSFFYGEHNIVLIAQYVLNQNGGYRLNLHDDPTMDRAMTRTRTRPYGRGRGRGTRSGMYQGRLFPKDTTCLSVNDSAILGIGSLFADLFNTLVPEEYVICRHGDCRESNPLFNRLSYVSNFVIGKTYVTCSRSGHRFCNRCGLVEGQHSYSRECPASDQQTILLAMKGAGYPCPGQGCRRIMDKLDGCNHMTCPTCNTHSCFLCHKSLDLRRGEVTEHFRGGVCHQFD